MKYCNHHWTMLRIAIDVRGLTHLVARDGAEAVKRLKSEADGTATPFTYDPLMAAHNMVIARALKLGGIGMLGTAPDGGEYCPVCEAMRGHASYQSAQITERHYTDGPADAALAYCRESGLLALDDKKKEPS